MDVLPLLGRLLGTMVVGGIWAAFVAALVRILDKAGYSPWWLLIAIVPGVNVIMFFVFAFGDWPVHQELRAEREARARLHPLHWPEE